MARFLIEIRFSHADCFHFFYFMNFQIKLKAGGLNEFFNVDPTKNHSETKNKIDFLMYFTGMGLNITDFQPNSFTIEYFLYGFKFKRFNFPMSELPCNDFFY